MTREMRFVEERLPAQLADVVPVLRVASNVGLHDAAGT